MEHTILVVADIRGYIYRQGPVQVEYTILVVADIGGTSIAGTSTGGTHHPSGG